MGLLDWFARRGNVGGTARWAAAAFVHFREELPSSAGTTEVYRAMTLHRIAARPDPPRDDALLRRASEARGLAELVVGILAVEAGLEDLSADHQHRFRKIIVEELRRKGIADADINRPKSYLPG